MLALTQADRTAFEASAAAAATLLRTLANERRLMILCQLLALLREEGVVATRRQSQTIFYRISDPAAVKVIATLASIFCPEIPE